MWINRILDDISFIFLLEGEDVEGRVGGFRVVKVLYVIKVRVLVFLCFV